VAGLSVSGLGQVISPVRSPPRARQLPGKVRETKTCRELARRTADGLNVTLLWSSVDDRLAVAVSDAKSGRHFELDAPRDRALDVFYHPYAYASASGGC
jgi:hypothetical protein